MIGIWSWMENHAKPILYISIVLSIISVILLIVCAIMNIVMNSDIEELATKYEVNL